MSTHRFYESTLDIPTMIQKHIQKRRDVEVVQHFEEYLAQFYKQCTRLQQYLYSAPKIKSKYLNQSDPHFKYALQHLFLDLYRRGVITPNSYDNLKEQAVEQIQRWVLGWIHRKLLYEQTKAEEKNYKNNIKEILKEINNYVKVIQVEELPF